MAPSKTEKAKPAAPVFLHDVVIQANVHGAAVDPGGPDAAIAEALGRGLRPNGDATLTGPKLHADGESQVFTWSVPVTG